jgi:hypothetical protein
VEAKKALEIICRLADGVNPVTGEVFDADSPYQNVEIVRALNAATDALKIAEKYSERKKMLPERAGQSWEKQETERLAAGFDSGTSIEKLAKTHQRTNGAIRSQLIRMGKIAMP